MTKVAVLGAGINGLACAVRIQEKYPEVQVTIFASKFTPDTTGDGSGGLWNPYLCGNTSDTLLTKWGIETFEYIHKLWKEGGYDITLIPMYELFRQERQLPHHTWTKSVFGYRTMGKKELDYLNSLSNVKYVAGRMFTSFVVFPPAMLRHLTQIFIKGNGKVVRTNISSLDDPCLDSYDVVVNCTGLGARNLVPDTNVYPIRGQIMKMDAPWIAYSIVDDKGHYIIPNPYNCVIGGTHQENNYSYSVDEKDTAFITNGCQEIIPGLKHAGLIKQWVGLRPGRTELRLEAEERGGRLYIHNYGHGGSGLTLFWGCSSDVLDIFDKYMTKGKPISKSKL